MKFNDEPYFIIKEGYFYGHNSCGYVSSPLLAELYNEDYAKQHAETVGCYAVSLSSQRIGIERIDAVIERLTAIKEYLKDVATPHETARPNE